MRLPTLIALLALTGCPKTTPPQAAAQPAPAEAARTMPGPLATPAFKMPTTETRTLSNGLKVVVATNHEVPLFDLRLVLDVGDWTDPKGKDGLTEVTFDMLNEGAGDLTAEQLSRKLKLLGSNLYTGANIDSAYVGASGLVKNMGPTLDLWTTVLTQPTFPADEWTVLQKRDIANVKVQKEEPNSIARQTAYRILYGDSYRGRYPTEASYQAISPKDMTMFYHRWVGPENAVLFVGGDVTADQIVPLLDKRIGSWDPDVTEAKPQADLKMSEGGTLYFVDKPGAAQSVLRVMLPVGTRQDADFFPLLMANEALGGEFTSRINMNLREDKGYTYGARCFLGNWDGPGVWGCVTSVQTKVTVPALEQLKKEITDALSTRPIEPRELTYFQSMEVNAFPANYETTGQILDEQATIWRYGLPTDWAEQYLPHVQAVTVDEANQALKDRIDPSKLVWVVVGDKKTVYDGLKTLGLKVVQLDRDGNVVQGG